MVELSVMEECYDWMFEEFGVIDLDMFVEDCLILCMVWVFGECELMMLEGFVECMKWYIECWCGL